MPITFRCIVCNNEIVVDEQYAGKKGRCTSCGELVRIPSPHINADDIPKRVEERHVKEEQSTPADKLSSLTVADKTQQPAEHHSGNKILLILGIIIVGLLSMILALFLRIGFTSGTNEPAIPFVTDAPLTSLKRVAALLTKGPPQFKNSIADVQFDVSKTDSLVSPYRGTLSFKQFHSSTDTPTGRKFNELTGNRGYDEYNVILAWQDGEWVPKGGTMVEGQKGHANRLLDHRYGPLWEDGVYGIPFEIEWALKEAKK